MSVWVWPAPQQIELSSTKRVGSRALVLRYISATHCWVSGRYLPTFLPFSSISVRSPHVSLNTIHEKMAGWLKSRLMSCGSVRSDSRRASGVGFPQKLGKSDMMSSPSLSAQYNLRGTSILMCVLMPFRPISLAICISLRINSSLGKV